MSKFSSITEAAKEILDASVTSKRGGQDKPMKVPVEVAYGLKDAGRIGSSPDEEEGVAPDYTKGTPKATPPGATPPVGSEPDGVGAQIPKGQPQETMGRSDLKLATQQSATDYSSIRDRIKAKLAPNNFKSNPGATFQSYDEDVEVDEDEEIIDEAKDEEQEAKEQKMKERRKAAKQKMKGRMEEDVAALLSGENLSEEFKQKATTIFEAAVIARAEEVVAEVEEELVDEFNEAVEEIKEHLTDQLNDYLEYMVEEWMEENRLAVETGLRAEIAEEFITKLRDLFVESYIEIPEEKVDVVEELAKKVEELEDQLNEEIEKNVEFVQTIKEHRKIETIAAVCEGLTQTQVEKIKTLAESVEFTNEEEFAEKIATLVEGYFSNNTVVPSKSDLNEEVEYEEEPNKGSSVSEMDIYAKAISRTVAK